MTISSDVPTDRTLTRSDFLKRTTAGIAAVTASTLLAKATRAQTAGASAPAVITAEKPYDMREFIEWAIRTFEPTVKLPGGAGHYCRKPGEPMELYGSADMACVFYTLGMLKPTEKERMEWAEAFQQFQQPDTGWLIEKTPTHPALHNLAYSLAAMQLLDLTPKNPVVLGPEYADIKTYLDTLNWKSAVYTESHKGAGICSASSFLPQYGTKEWFTKYFAYTDALVDPRNGLMGKEKPAGGDFDMIGGTFHYFFNYNHFNRQMAYPEKRIDTVLALQRPDGHWDTSNKTWLTLDGIYLLTRTLRVCHHRPDDVRAAIRKTLDQLMRDMYSPDVRGTAFNGRIPTHSLVCALSILAEAQQFFGAAGVISEWPLKLVLDRRPFI